VEKQASYSDLQKLLESYPLYSTSTIRHHPCLKLIQSVKNISIDFGRSPRDLAKIIINHLGTKGEANIRKHLEKILQENPISMAIFPKLRQCKNYHEALRLIRSMRNNSKCKDMAIPIHDCLAEFMGTKDHWTYRDLQAALNFVSQKLQNILLRLVAKQLYENINKKLDFILKSKSNSQQQLKKVKEALLDKRYQDVPAKIEEEYLKIWKTYFIREIIRKISYCEKEMRSYTGKENRKEYAKRLVNHIFASKEVPRIFLEMLLEAISSNSVHPKANDDTN
jgi:hypothetical protein